jgi:hypothetical protein
VLACRHPATLPQPARKKAFWDETRFPRCNPVVVAACRLPGADAATAAGRPYQQRDRPAAGSGRDSRPGAADAGAAQAARGAQVGNLQRRRQQCSGARSAVRAGARRQGQCRYPPRHHRHRVAQRHQPDAAATADAHRQAGRHALRTRRPEPRRHAGFALPETLQGRLREHGAQRDRNDLDQHPDQHHARRQWRRRAPRWAAAPATSRTPRIENKSNNQFWDSLEKNIKDILRETDKILPEGSSETVVEQANAQTATGAAALPQGASPRAAQALANAMQGNAALGSSSQTTGNSVVRRNTFREAASVIINPESGVDHGARHGAPARKDPGVHRPRDRLVAPPGADRGHHRRSHAGRRLPARHRVDQGDHRGHRRRPVPDAGVDQLQRRQRR